MTDKELKFIHLDLFENEVFLLAKVYNKGVRTYC